MAVIDFVRAFSIMLMSGASVWGPLTGVHALEFLLEFHARCYGQTHLSWWYLGPRTRMKHSENLIIPHFQSRYPSPRFHFSQMSEPYDWLIEVSSQLDWQKWFTPEYWSWSEYCIDHQRSPKTILVALHQNMEDLKILFDRFGCHVPRMEYLSFQCPN